MRLSIFLCKILQTLAILLCSELLFLPFLCSLALGLLALASLMLLHQKHLAVEVLGAEARREPSRSVTAIGASSLSHDRRLDAAYTIPPAA
jgi:hypothetical protein